MGDVDNVAVVEAVREPDAEGDDDSVRLTDGVTEALVDAVTVGLTEGEEEKEGVTDGDLERVSVAEDD